MKNKTDNSKIPVCLKTFLKVSEKVSKEDSEESKKDFDNEKEFFEKLSKSETEHIEHIVKCYGITNISGREYIVMDNLYTKGFEPLSTALKKQEYEQHTESLLEIKQKITNLKDTLLTSTIHHNDLLEKNIMINIKTKEVILIDFGTASFVGEEDTEEEEQSQFKLDTEGYNNIIKSIDEFCNIETNKSNQIASK